MIVVGFSMIMVQNDLDRYLMQSIRIRQLNSAVCVILGKPLQARNVHVG